MLVTAGTVQVNGYAMFAVDRAEAAFQAGQAQAAHLAMVQATQQQAEQDAGIERPGSQCASVPGGFHGGESTIRMNGRVALLLQDFGAALQPYRDTRPLPQVLHRFQTRRTPKVCQAARSSASSKSTNSIANLCRGARCTNGTDAWCDSRILIELLRYTGSTGMPSLRN
ncbi:hypothetical protein GLGCALEP_02451 [Pseudomonas sp. MM221]|nr:hypothetical protein DBADOPDK_02385 [Pseudomonas sp. MM223]CAI3800290.1 hypothetical protein GLGCALEP_02451 [Pseudomonas sp. MM221]